MDRDDLVRFLHSNLFMQEVEKALLVRPSVGRRAGELQNRAHCCCATKHMQLVAKPREDRVKRNNLSLRRLDCQLLNWPTRTDALRTPTGSFRTWASA